MMFTRLKQLVSLSALNVTANVVFRQSVSVNVENEPCTTFQASTAAMLSLLQILSLNDTVQINVILPSINDSIEATAATGPNSVAIQQ